MSEKFVRYSRFLKHLQVFIDTILLNISYCLAFFICFSSTSIFGENPLYQKLMLFFNMVWLLLLYINKPYDKTRLAASIISGVYASSILVVILHASIITSFWLVFGMDTYALNHLILTYLSFAIVLFIWKTLYVSFFKYYRLKGYNIRNVLIIGRGQLTEDVDMFFKKYPELGYRQHFISTINDSENAISLSSISSYVEQNKIHEVYCCLPQMHPELVRNIVNYGENLNIKIKLISDFRGFVTKNINLEYLGYIPVLNINTTSLKDFKAEVVKRVFDVAFSFGVLSIGLPVYLIVGIVTKLTSKGPMFYSQERIGRWGKPFKIYKFRSMYDNAESNGPKLSNDFDPRITAWGRFMRKTRLDEIPQFFNVLIGDMSVVGPRPERQHFINRIVETAPHYRRLHTVKPGITSIGQVMYGYAENVEQMVKRLRFDILYLNNFSIAFDVKLVMLTLKVMAQGKGK